MIIDDLTLEERFFFEALMIQWGLRKCLCCDCWFIDDSVETEYCYECETKFNRKG